MEGSALTRRETSIARPMSPVAQRLDLARQAVLFLDGDPLEHLEALPQLADFVAQALVLGLGLGFEPLVAAVTPAAPAADQRHG